MFDADPAFRPARRRDGCLALEDMALVGDGTTSALVGLDGSVVWLCLPRFDSEPLFCGLLDHARGGRFTVAPDEVVEARQRYEPDTAVLITELRSPTGLVAVTDALALRPGTDLSDNAPAGHRELIRSAVVLDGSVRLRVELDPRRGAVAHAAAGGLALEASGRHDLDLHLRGTRPLESLRTVHELRAGDRLDVVLSWAGGDRHHRFTEEELLAATAHSWRRWMDGFHYDGPEATLVRRAAITLKLCDHWSNGAIVAAPTSSLPAPIGGVRNWDYRYTWIRGGYPLDAHLWTRLASLADLAMDAWRLPDQGIWEVRSEGRVFTYSGGLCQVALDRAARLAEMLELSRPVLRWRRAAEDLRDTVLERSWDEGAQTLSEHLDGGGSLDASLLALPLRRVVPAEHPRMWRQQRR